MIWANKLTCIYHDPNLRSDTQYKKMFYIFGYLVVYKQHRQAIAWAS